MENNITTNTALNFTLLNKGNKLQKDKKRSTKYTHKTKDRVTRTPLKTIILLF
jgi:hypothetical protein